MPPVVWALLLFCLTFFTFVVFINLLGGELLKHGNHPPGVGHGGAPPQALWYYYRMKKTSGEPLGWRFHVTLWSAILSVAFGILICWTW